MEVVPLKAVLELSELLMSSSAELSSVLTWLSSSTWVCSWVVLVLGAVLEPLSLPLVELDLLQAMIRPAKHAAVASETMNLVFMFVNFNVVVVEDRLGILMVV